MTEISSETSALFVWASLAAVALGLVVELWLLHRGGAR